MKPVERRGKREQDFQLLKEVEEGNGWFFGGARKGLEQWFRAEWLWVKDKR